MTKDEALRLALEALQELEDTNSYWWQEVDEVTTKKIDPAITAIKAALEAKDEPVAWMCADESLINKGYARFSHVCMGEWKIPVYTTPSQRTWVGLTDKDWKRSKHTEDFEKGVDWAEAMLKAKNT